MSILDQLEVTNTPERTKAYDPVRIRRKKLAAALQEQFNLLVAVESGQPYRRTSVQRKRDLETDEVVRLEQDRRVVPWWTVDDGGLVRFSLRYGSAKLIVRDGKDVILVKSIPELRSILPQLRQEVLAGGLDGALEAAATVLQTRFKAKKKAKGAA